MCIQCFLKCYLHFSGLFWAAPFERITKYLDFSLQYNQYNFPKLHFFSRTNITHILILKLLMFFGQSLIIYIYFIFMYCKPLFLAIYRVHFLVQSSSINLRVHYLIAGTCFLMNVAWIEALKVVPYLSSSASILVP